MRPLGSAATTPTTQTHTHSNGETQADRELLIDIDFFDAQGRWNPTHVVFCTAEDKTRAKSLWTRCFRGLMALHGKLWAKNYLSSHFQNKPEATKLLQTIQETGVVDNRSFRETVAHCTLLYENLNNADLKEPQKKYQVVTESPIQNLEKIVIQHFKEIDWKKLSNECKFDWVTLDMAHNIERIFENLTPNEHNDKVALAFREFMGHFDKWVGDLPANSGAQLTLIDQFLLADESIQYQKRADITDIIFGAIDKYICRSEDEKILNELRAIVGKTKGQKISSLEGS